VSTRAVALRLCPNLSLTLFILDIVKWFHWTYAPWYMSLLYMYLPFPILLLIVLIFYVCLVKSFYNALWCFFPTVGQLYTYPVQDTPSPFLWCMSNVCSLYDSTTTAWPCLCTCMKLFVPFGSNGSFTIFYSSTTTLLLLCPWLQRHNAWYSLVFTLPSPALLHESIVSSLPSKTSFFYFFLLLDPNDPSSPGAPIVAVTTLKNCLVAL
jgi:hypothetical protein